MSNKLMNKTLVLTKSNLAWGTGVDAFSTGDRIKATNVSMPPGMQTNLRDINQVGGKGAYTINQPIGQMDEQPFSFGGFVRGDDVGLLKTLPAIMGEYGATTTTFITHKFKWNYPMTEENVEDMLLSGGMDVGEGSARVLEYMASILPKSLEVTYNNGLSFTMNCQVSEKVRVTPSAKTLDSATFNSNITKSMFGLSGVNFYFRPFSSSSWGDPHKISNFTLSINRNSASLGPETGDTFQSQPVETSGEPTFTLTIQGIQHRAGDNTIYNYSQSGEFLSLKMVCEGLEIGTTNQNYTFELYMPKVTVEDAQSATESPSPTTNVFRYAQSTTVPTGFTYSEPLIVIKNDVAALTGYPAIT